MKAKFDYTKLLNDKKIDTILNNFSERYFFSDEIVLKLCVSFDCDGYFPNVYNIEYNIVAVDEDKNEYILPEFKTPYEDVIFKALGKVENYLNRRGIDINYYVKNGKHK